MREADLRKSPPNRGEDVAIIGMACVYPGARNLSEFWQNIIGKRSAITEPSEERLDRQRFFDPDPAAEDKIYCLKGGWIGDSFYFNPLKHGTMPRAVPGAEPDQFLVLRTVYEALQDAGYVDRQLGGERASFVLGRGNYLGAGLAGLIQRGMITQQTLDVISGVLPDISEDDLNRIKTALREALPSLTAENAPGIIPNLTTGRVCNRLDLMGRNFTIDAACASSLIAVELGIRGLSDRSDDLVIAGGVHVFSNFPFLQVFTAMKALSLSSTIRPFDQFADGTIAGEGVGILVLKRLSDAERDGDRIYAVIKGVGVSSDGKATSVTAPRFEGEVLAMRRAYAATGISPQSIRLIEAHGTGTKVGDTVEAKAMREVFGPRDLGRPSIAVGSIKSMIGHTMPAAGAAGLIKTALALYHKVLPPSLNVEQPSEELTGGDSRFYVNTEARPWTHSRRDGPRRAGVSAFGFGGVNAHVILEEPATGDEESRPTLLRDWPAELFLLEANSRTELLALIRRLTAYAGEASGVPLRNLAYTLNTSLKGLPHRLALVAESMPDLAAKLHTAEKRLADPSRDQIKDSQGIFYFGDPAKRSGKIALLFPGEGSQYIDMLRELCVYLPEVRESFDLADSSVSAGTDACPSMDIFPPPAFTIEDAATAEARLCTIERATESVLTAGGAIAQLLYRLGFRADMMAGHSAGEWVALAASGIVKTDAFVASIERLERVYRAVTANTSIPAMTMLAVGAGKDKVEKLVAGIDRDIHVANDNCPHQVVIVCGPEDEEVILSRLKAGGIYVEKLPYDRGYHTPVFTYINEPLRQYFSEMEIGQPEVPVYCCTTADPLPNDPRQVLDIVSTTFTKPLLFRQTIERMYEDGARIFVEAGPRGNLTAFVDDILRKRPHLAIPTDQYQKPGLAVFQRALAMLGALHLPLDLTPLYSRRAPRKLSLDATADRPPREEDEPGSIEVSLCYPRLKIPPAVARPQITPVAKPADSQPGAAPAAAAMESPGFGHAAVSETQSPARPSVLDEHFQLMQTFLDSQEEVMRSYLDAAAGMAQAPPASGGTTRKTGPPRKDPAPAHSDPPAAEVFVATDPPSPEETVAPPAPMEPVPQPQRAGTGQQEVEHLLLEVISEKTGYPVEMLDPDLDMEAELGIDSIKRVEILGTLQQLAVSSEMKEGAMEEIARLKTIRQVTEYLRSMAAGGTDNSAPASRVAGARELPLIRGSEITHLTPEREIVVRCVVDLSEHRYLTDHRFDLRGNMLVVPLTIALEMMAEVASLLAPGRKVTRIRKMQTAKWIEAEAGQPAPILEFRAQRIAGDTVQVSLFREDHALNGSTSTRRSAISEATVVFGNEFPGAPEPVSLDLVNPRRPAVNAEQLYSERLMFHGPMFQGVDSLDQVAENGLLAKTKVLPTDNLLASHPDPKFIVDPYLLDAVGQLVGYWPTEFLNEGYVVFPIRLEELTLYQGNLEPGGRSECRLSVREVTSHTLTADIDVFGTDGRLWMRVTGWQDWRFYWSRYHYDFWRFPQKTMVGRAVSLSSNGGRATAVCRRVDPVPEIENATWEYMWAHLLLSGPEMETFRQFQDRVARREWLFERAAAKGALQAWMKEQFDVEFYPTDVDLAQKSGNGFTASGELIEKLGIAPLIAVTRRGLTAVAVTGDGELAVEMVELDNSSDGIQFTPVEQELLNGIEERSRPKAVSMALAARQAAARILGDSLNGGDSGPAMERIEPGHGEIHFVAETGAQVVAHCVFDGKEIIAVAKRTMNPEETHNDT